jgi:uncharacterized membrane protein
MNISVLNRIMSAVSVFACMALSVGSLQADDNAKLKTLMNQRKALRAQIERLVEFAQSADRQVAYEQSKLIEARDKRNRNLENWRQANVERHKNEASHAREQIVNLQNKIGDIDLEIATRN